MRDDLLTYYERELTFMRRMAGEFAEKYPKIAGRLQLEAGKCEDPHVERLIESFALVAARIHLRLDDEFPEISESLLQVLYPHYLAPVPSMSVVQFELDLAQGKLTTGYTIDRHQPLSSRRAMDTVCQFRTCYPVTLWPIECATTRAEATGAAGVVGQQRGAVILGLRTQGETTFQELEVAGLRFFLGGESRVAHQLYELLFGHCTQIEVRTPAGAKRPLSRLLPPSSLREVGFGRDEGLLPYSNRSFVGYRLLQEYFHFPEKYLFLDVAGLECLREAGFDQDAELVFHVDHLPRFDHELESKNSAWAARRSSICFARPPSRSGSIMPTTRTASCRTCGGSGPPRSTRLRR